MNPYHEESGVETSSETWGNDTPTTGTFTCATPTMDDAALRLLYASGSTLKVFQ